MEIVEKVIGNIHDDDWRIQFQDANIEYLDLDQWEAQKNRFRKKTRHGEDVGISLKRGEHLRDGDVVEWDEASRRAVVVAIQFKDVMVIQLAGLMKQPTDISAQTFVELGHALGNQHWPAVVKGSQVYVPVTVDSRVMASVMKTHAFPGITYDFVTGAEVIPYLAPHEARRLFGGTDLSCPHSCARHMKAKNMKF